MGSPSNKLMWLNSLADARAKEEFFKCCGCGEWAERMVRLRPFRSDEELYLTADREWKKIPPAGVLEAFSHHPKIGDLGSLRTKFASTGEFTTSEQSGVKTASDDILGRLAQMNRQYEEKFGYIFIVCATGKSAAEMLRILESRIDNTKEVELGLAAAEQQKIMRLRLERILRS